jgi:hypothetical protein
MTWWIWILVGLGLLVVEVVIPGGVVLLFFGAAAIVVGSLVGFGVAEPVWLQWLLFSILSIVSLVTLRGPILRRMRKGTQGAPSVDSLVGEAVVLLEDVAPGGEGKAELRGTSWTARNVGAGPMRKGGRGVVEKVEGLKLLVRSS